MTERNPYSDSSEIEDLLERYYCAPQPSAQFAAHLRAQIRQSAAARPARRPLFGGPVLARAAVSAVLFLALAGLAIFSLRSRPQMAGGATGTATTTPEAASATAAPSATEAVTATPAAPVPLAVSPRLCALDAPTATPDPNLPVLGRRPDNPLNQGLVQSGDFSFELLLYCSAEFAHSGSVEFVHQESEIEGLGVYAAYNYEGTQMLEGETSESSGFVPYVRYSGGGGPALGPGSGGRTVTGIQFPDDVLVDLSGEATPLRFIYKVQDPRGAYAGAALSFTLRLEMDGYSVSDIQVAPLSAEELAAEEYPDVRLPERDPGEIHPLLAELHDLLARAETDLTGQPGWVHIASHIINPEKGGTLPNGAQVPAEYTADAWYLLGEGARIETAVNLARYADERINQVSVYQDGVWENRTFNTSSRSPNERLGNLDGGVYADAVRAARSGQVLTREETEEGLKVTTDSGTFRKIALLDPESGQVRWTEGWQLKEGNWELFYRTELVAMERAAQPPDDVLALMDLPAQTYQPLPPEGTPAPAGFDPAHSKLRMVQIAGDDFSAPTFWYGDLYADEYLLGRVDFGGVPGGWCQRSTDGSKIAFQYQDAENIASLRWLDLRDPATVHDPLPTYGLGRLMSPLAWSPVAPVLAFSACQGESGCGLYLLDVEREELRLIASASSPWSALWKPDGSELAIIVPDAVSQGSIQELIVYRAADGKVLYSGPANYPEVDPGSPAASWGVSFPVGAVGFECE